MAFPQTVKLKVTGARGGRGLQGEPGGAISADLAASTGATLVGANDASSGAKYTTVQGFVTYLLSSAGSAIVGFLQAGTGALSRTMQARLRDTVHVTDFTGCDPTGATDSSAAFINAIAAGSSVFVPPGAYQLAAGVTLTAGKSLIGSGRGCTTVNIVGDITGLTITGSNCEIRGITFAHAGNGRIIDATQDEDLILEDCGFTGASVAATAAMIYCSGSFAGIRRCSITNLRTGTGAYALMLDRTGSTINIESHIEQNRFGGTGRAIWIGSSDNSARPEGIYISNNTFIGTNINLWVEQILQLNITANVFDQGTTQQIVFKPVNTGIENVQINANYISTPNQTTNGIGIDHDNTNSSVPLRYISLVGNSFAFCGYGVAFKSGASYLTITSNNLAAVGSAGFQINQSKNVTISDNVFNSMTFFNLQLTDGAAGGPFSIDGNQFDSTAANSFTKTSNDKFLFGNLNTGKKLAGWSSVATNTTTKPSGSFIAIPHGLDGTPRKDRIIVSVIEDTAAFAPTPGANVASIDSTNITVEVGFTAAVGGDYSVVALASL